MTIGGFYPPRATRLRPEDRQADNARSNTVMGVCVHVYAFLPLHFLHTPRVRRFCACKRRGDSFLTCFPGLITGNLTTDTSAGCKICFFAMLDYRGPYYFSRDILNCHSDILDPSRGL